MKKGQQPKCEEFVFSKDNVRNLRTVLACSKNILICGIKGVGKITNTINAVRDNTNVHYVGNPVDFEGKTRPGSYDKYLRYISSMKKDIAIVGRIEDLFSVKDNIILIIDELYGRGGAQLDQIGRILDMKNIQVLQIVGCIKYTGRIIEKMDVVVELHMDGAFVIDKELAQAICRILGTD